MITNQGKITFGALIMRVTDEGLNLPQAFELNRAAREGVTIPDPVWIRSDDHRIFLFTGGKFVKPDSPIDEATLLLIEPDPTS